MGDASISVCRAGDRFCYCEGAGCCSRNVDRVCQCNCSDGVRRLRTLAFRNPCLRAPTRVGQWSRLPVQHASSQHAPARHLRWGCGVAVLYALELRVLPVRRFVCRPFRFCAAPTPGPEKQVSSYVFCILHPPPPTPRPSRAPPKRQHRLTPCSVASPHRAVIVSWQPAASRLRSSRLSSLDSDILACCSREFLFNAIGLDILAKRRVVRLSRGISLFTFGLRPIIAALPIARRKSQVRLGHLSTLN